jgi:hypothetical protein
MQLVTSLPFGLTVALRRADEEVFSLAAVVVVIGAFGGGSLKLISTVG